MYLIQIYGVLKMSKLMYAIFCSLIFSSCTLFQDKSEKSDDGKVPTDSLNGDLAHIEAKVIDAQGLDGCKWLIETTKPDGTVTRVQPLNLDDSFQIDGLKVKIKYKQADGMAGICMAGPIVNIEEIKIAD